MRKQTKARRAPAKSSTSKSKVATPARWTLMVYLAGDNNLDGAGVVDLQEMKKTGSSDQINVLAQFDRAGSKISTKRYRLRAGTTLQSDLVGDLGETNTGDPAVLRNFLTWGIKNYPSDHYMVVLWNHGAGWDDSNLYQGDYFGGSAPPIAHKGVAIDKGSVATKARRSAGKPVPLAQARAAVKRARRALFGPTVQKMVQKRAIAFDDQAQDFLDNTEMKKVMLSIKKALGRKVDILGFDACLMSMLEVSYQIKNTANFTVGSQEEEPNNGWPYDRIVAALAKNPAIKPADLARDMVGHYLASYGPNEGVTFAATDLAQVSSVATAVSALGSALSKALKDKTQSAAISTVRSLVQEYTQPYDQYVDLIDLCDGLEKYVSNAAVSKACKAVRTAVAKAILASGAKGKSVAHSHGTSVYFPKKQVCKLYSTLDFAKKNGWATFIGDYVGSLGTRGWG